MHSLSPNICRYTIYRLRDNNMFRRVSDFACSLLQDLNLQSKLLSDCKLYADVHFLLAQHKITDIVCS